MKTATVMVMISVGFGLGLGLGFGFGATAQASPDNLTGAQITQQLAGKSHLYCGATQGWLIMNKDGTAQMHDSKFGKSAGRWWIKADQMCRQWDLWPKQKFCTNLVAVRPGEFQTSDGFKVYAFAQKQADMTCARAAKQ